MEYVKLRLWCLKVCSQVKLETLRCLPPQMQCLPFSVVDNMIHVHCSNLSANHLAALEGLTYNYGFNSSTRCDWASSTKTHTDKHTSSMLFDGGYSKEIGTAKLLVFRSSGLDKDRHGISQFARLCALGRCFDECVTSFDPSL